MQPSLCHPLPSRSLLSSHTVLTAVPQTLQAPSSLRARTLALNSLPQTLPPLPAFFSFRFQLKCHSLKEVSSNSFLTLAQEDSFPTLHPFLYSALFSECFSLSDDACACAKLLQSYPTLCDPMASIPPGCSAHEILQARILEWIAMPSSGDLPHPGTELMFLTSPVLAGGFFTSSTTLEAHQELLKLNNK